MIGIHRMTVVVVVLGIVVGSTTACQRSTVSQVRVTRLESDDPAGPGVRFRVRWPRSQRRGAQYDALWLFGKVRYAGGPWQHLEMASVDLPASAGLDTDRPSDGRGFFIFRARDGAGPVEFTARAAWHPAAPSGDLGEAEIRLFVLDMVHVAGGPFGLGDGEIADLAGHLQTAGRGTPFRIESDSALNLGVDTVRSLSNSNAYGMAGGQGDDLHTPAAVPDDFNDAARLSLAAGYPTGFAPFYLMTYELTQQQYADFLNTLTPVQFAARLPPAEQVGPGRDRWSLDRIPPVSATVPDRPINYLSWMDLAAYADWAALRPMSEFEFEKAARGVRTPAPGEFAWGTTIPHRRRYALADDGTPMERPANAATDRPNASYRATHGHPQASCASCIRGPLPVTAFRTYAGEVSGVAASGAHHLSGNLFERVVSVGHAVGRRFRPIPGDGDLSANGFAAGPEVSTWPGAVTAGGTAVVTGALGSGLRGGSWASSAARLRVSDRALAATSDPARRPTYGARLARSVN